MRKRAYLNEITDDLKDFVDGYDLGEFADYDDFCQKIYDDAFVADSVTGNASGSYTFNTYQAEENLSGAWDLLAEAMEEFGCSDVNPMERGAEWADVTIRCYLLAEACADVLPDIWEEEQQTECETIEA